MQFKDRIPGKLRKLLLDTQVFSGSVKRGSVRWIFLGVFSCLSC